VATGAFEVRTEALALGAGCPAHRHTGRWREADVPNNGCKGCLVRDAVGEGVQITPRNTSNSLRLRNDVVHEGEYATAAA